MPPADAEPVPVNADAGQEAVETSEAPAPPRDKEDAPDEGTTVVEQASTTVTLTNPTDAPITVAVEVPTAGDAAAAASEPDASVKPEATVKPDAAVKPDATGIEAGCHAGCPEGRDATASSSNSWKGGGGGGGAETVAVDAPHCADPGGGVRGPGQHPRQRPLPHRRQPRPQPRAGDDARRGAGGAQDGSGARRPRAPRRPLDALDGAGVARGAARRPDERGPGARVTAAAAARHRARRRGARRVGRGRASLRRRVAPQDDRPLHPRRHPRPLPRGGRGGRCGRCAARAARRGDTSRTCRPSRPRCDRWRTPSAPDTPARRRHRWRAQSRRRWGGRRGPAPSRR